MEYIGRSRANRIPLDKAAAQRLSGDFYLEFKKFYDFLKQEKNKYTMENHGQLQYEI